MTRLLIRLLVRSLLACVFLFIATFQAQADEGATPQPLTAAFEYFLDASGRMDLAGAR